MESKKKLGLLDENVKNLNKVTDDNCKAIDRLVAGVSNIKIQVDNHENAIDSHEKSLITINKEIAKMMNLEETVTILKEKTAKKFAKLKKKVNFV